MFSQSLTLWPSIPQNTRNTSTKSKNQFRTNKQKITLDLHHSLSLHTPHTHFLPLLPPDRLNGLRKGGFWQHCCDWTGQRNWLVEQSSLGLISRLLWFSFFIFEGRIKNQWNRREDKQSQVILVFRHFVVSLKELHFRHTHKHTHAERWGREGLHAQQRVRGLSGDVRCSLLAMFGSPDFCLNRFAPLVVCVCVCSFLSTKAVR